MGKPRKKKNHFFEKKMMKRIKGAVLKFKGVSEGKPVSGTTTTI